MAKAAVRFVVDNVLFAVATIVRGMLVFGPCFVVRSFVTFLFKQSSC